MATAGCVLDTPSKIAYHLWLMAKANGPAAIVEAVQEYLASWTKERVTGIQKIDAGWAPFDGDQRPLQVSGALDLRCIRDAVHSHCMALREAGMALTPEFVELDEFFFAATEMIENFGRSPSNASTRATRTEAVRTPTVPAHTAAPA